MPATSGPQTVEMVQTRSVATGGSNAGEPGGILRRLHRDRSGTVGMMFGLLVIPLTAVVGLAVDYGRVYSIKSHTQAALDAAALAAGRVAQVDKTTSMISNAENAAIAFFNESKPTSVISSSLQFSPSAQQTEFTVTATSWVRTPFLGVLNALFRKDGGDAAPGNCQGNYFGCVMLTSTATAKYSTGLNGGSNVEVALMLDVTGSMCSPCSKIDALKVAAKDLIDIVVVPNQTDITSRVALAPFADAVNVGTTLAPLIRNTTTGNSSSPSTYTTTATLNDTSNQPTKSWIKFNSVNGSNSGGCTTSGTDNCLWQIHSKCVTERVGVHAYDDTVPNTTVADTLVGKGYFSNSATSGCAVADYTDPEVNLIMPLTKDKTALKARIDKLSTGGSTAGHLGTAWAYYLLSPNWNNLFPSASQAGSYSDLVGCNFNFGNTSCNPNPIPAPKLKKIAVLMTDGEYNINYCKGVEAKNSDQSPDINCNSENGKSLAQATSMCTAMKTSKIEVFTVGFQVNSTARTFLKNCATDASHFYDATTGDALKQAFRDIALKIVPLQLTN